MKALIPVAGAGVRLRPHTFTQPKPLIPVAGKPIIAFIVDQLIDAGIREFIFIIGYLGEKIEHYIAEKYPDLDVTYVHQPQRMGLGHAIWLTKEYVKDDEDIFIVLGDTIFDADLPKMLAFPDSCIGLKKVDDPRKFGVAELGEDNFVKSLTEKPKIPKSNLAIVGLYKIKNAGVLFDCLERNIQNEYRTHNEFQLTDGLMCMIEKGEKIAQFPVNNWFDCGRREILLETNAMLLKRPQYQCLPSLEDSEDTIFIKPVHIGKNCKIKRSIIGPNVTIGDNTTVCSSIIRESIIGSDAALEDVMLHRSVVGSDASIKGLSQSLNIGDNTEIDFS